MATQTTSTPDEASQSVTLEVICDRQAIFASIANNSRATIDRFVEVMKEEQRDWSPDRIGYLITDLTKTLSGFNTPYGRAKMDELIYLRPNSPFYVAVIIPNNFLLTMARVVLNHLPRKTIYSHICFSRKEAVAWIEECIAKNKQTI